jgi:hypothetical protein
MQRRPAIDQYLGTRPVCFLSAADFQPVINQSLLFDTGGPYMQPNVATYPILIPRVSATPTLTLISTGSPPHSSLPIHTGAALSRCTAPQRLARNRDSSGVRGGMEGMPSGRRMDRCSSTEDPPRTGPGGAERSGERRGTPRRDGGGIREGVLGQLAAAIGEEIL